MDDPERVAEKLAAPGLLTQRQALAYALRDMGDLERDEAAEIMGCDVSTVDDHLRVARRKIRQANETLDVLRDPL